MAKVSYCQYDGTVSGAQSVGGLIGSAAKADVANSYAKGKLTVEGSMDNGRNAGGLVGLNTGGFVDSSLAAVEIESKLVSKSVGRLLGYNDAGDVTNCFYNNTVGTKWPAFDIQSTGTQQVTGLSDQEFEYKLQQLIYPGK